MFLLMFIRHKTILVMRLTILRSWPSERDSIETATIWWDTTFIEAIYRKWNEYHNRDYDRNGYNIAGFLFIVQVYSFDTFRIYFYFLVYIMPWFFHFSIENIILIIQRAKKIFSIVIEYYLDTSYIGNDGFINRNRCSVIDFTALKEEW